MHAHADVPRTAGWEPAVTLSGIDVQTVIRAYCAGPSHNHHRIVIDGRASERETEHAVRLAGFRQTPDGRWWCKIHLPAHTNGSQA